MSDNPYQKYADDIQNVQKSTGTKEEKATALQGILNQLAQTMKAELEGGTPAVAANDMAAAFKAAVAPLAEQISLLNARLGVQTGTNQPQQVVTYVPQQKSMVVPNVQQQPVNQLPVSSVTGQPSEIAAQVRRSVGLQ